MRAREIELEGFVDNSWFIKNLKSTEQQMLRGCSEQFISTLTNPFKSLVLSLRKIEVVSG